MSTEEIYNAFFGFVPAQPEPAPHGVRVRITEGGGLARVHPKATGQFIVSVQQVPHNVSDAEAIRRLSGVGILRRYSQSYGCIPIHFSELQPGAIIR